MGVRKMEGSVYCQTQNNDRPAMEVDLQDVMHWPFWFTRVIKRRNAATVMSFEVGRCATELSDGFADFSTKSHTYRPQRCKIRFVGRFLIESCVQISSTRGP